MDLTQPPRQLSIAPADWRDMDGHEQDQPLLIRPSGPLLSAARRGWVVVTGWRDLPDEPGPVWTVAQVRQSAVVGEQ